MYCDLDLHHGHACLLPGARWDVTESAAARSFATKPFRYAPLLYPTCLGWLASEAGPVLPHVLSVASVFSHSYFTVILQRPVCEM